MTRTRTAPSLLDVPGVTWAVHMYPPDVAFDRALAAAKAGPSAAS
jgi:hypothetical protein